MFFCYWQVIAFIIPTKREFNYHYIKGDCYNHGAWIYARIAFNPTPVDIAFIGTSHTIYTFNEPIIENELPGTNIANFGYCRGGRNIHYVFLKNLIKHKHPKLVVIEVCLLTLFYGWTQHI